jgi:hypothetical protein
LTKKRPKISLVTHKVVISHNINKKNMELAGKIIAVLEARGGVSKATGNSWKTQDYVIETHEQYPRRMCFNVFGEDKISQMNIQVGDTLTVFFDINAREYNGRWYNDVRAWRIEPAGSTSAAPQAPVTPAAPSAPVAPPPTEVPEFTSMPEDDLPF